MNEPAQRYPLSWPAGWKRTPPDARARATFAKHSSQTEDRQGQVVRRKIQKPLSVSDAARRLEAELERLHATHEVLSTNVRLRMDGSPDSRLTDPVDPGAAVYFQLNNKPRCLACDKWDRVADNIAAIAQHIDALRRIDRYGIGDMERAFSGYAALQSDPSTDWRLVLGFNGTAIITPTMVDQRFKLKAKEAHPDAGGSAEGMIRLNAARVAALKELNS